MSCVVLAMAQSGTFDEAVGTNYVSCLLHPSHLPLGVATAAASSADVLVVGASIFLSQKNNRCTLCT